MLGDYDFKKWDNKCNETCMFSKYIYLNDGAAYRTTMCSIDGEIRESCKRCMIPLLRLKALQLQLSEDQIISPVILGEEEGKNRMSRTAEEWADSAREYLRWLLEHDGMPDDKIIDILYAGITLWEEKHKK